MSWMSKVKEWAVKVDQAVDAAERKYVNTMDELERKGMKKLGSERMMDEVVEEGMDKAVDTVKVSSKKVKHTVQRARVKATVSLYAAQDKVADVVSAAKKKVNNVHAQYVYHRANNEDTVNVSSVGSVVVR